MDVRSIFVVGSGIMGSGIAQTAIQSGFEVWLNDTGMEILEKARSSISSRIEQKVSKGKISAEDAQSCIKRLHITEKLDPVRDTELVIEAVYENMEAKSAIFKKLEGVCRDETILASNTSSLSITALAGNLKKPERFIGMHFFSPVPVMRLLEITRGLRSSDETCGTALEVGKKLDKVSIIAKDMPGFVVNRILDPMVNAAVRLFDEGIGSVESIDNGMKYACNHPMGPLELADLMGIDILYAVMETLHAELGDPQYSPAPLLKKMIRAGYLGKKAGAGFYLYDAAGKQTEINPVFRGNK